MEQRIRFLAALGIPETRISPARIINEIRNEFAHKERELFIGRDISRLQAAVETLYQRKIPDHFVLAINQKGVRQEWRFGEMNLKQKFCLMGSMVLTGVALIENDFPKINLARP